MFLHFASLLNLSMKLSCLEYCSNRLEKLSKDKHFSLLQKSVIYGQKQFYNIGPSMVETLRFFVLSMFRMGGGGWEKNC